MRPLPGTVFTHAEAVTLGWTMPALKHAVRSGRIVRLRRGVYASTGHPMTSLRAFGVARTVPVTISHRSAALVHGLPVLGRPPAVPEVTIPPRSNANIVGTHPYRAHLRAIDVVEIAGAPITSVARTLVDLARHRSIGLAVAAADHALHDGLVTLAQIDDVLAACRGWPYVRRAGHVRALVDADAESPLESVSRLVLRELGLPRAALQASIATERGRFVGRADFYWDEFGVVGEADGRGKYTDRTVLVAEKEREEALVELGLIVVRWGWRDVLDGRSLLHQRIERAFERGRARDRSGFPRSWTLMSPPWRP